MTTQSHTLDLGNTDDGIPPAGQAMLPPRGRRARGAISRAHTSTAAFFLLPNIVLVALFLIIPLGLTVWYSLQKLDFLGGSQFLGVNNYTDMFQDSDFWQAMLNTAIFTIVTVPVGMAIGLGLAVLLNGVLPGRVLFRSIIFLPLVISGVATGVLGAWMFDQYNGFFNKLIASLGFVGPDWNSNGTWAMVSVILMTLWQRVGFSMLIYLAGLQGVSPELLEAAEIDGATGWQRFRNITFPLLGPSTFFLTVMNFIYSFQMFDTVWAMTRGGPEIATTNLLTYAYRESFDEHGPQLLGYGAAIGIVIYLITLLITIANWRFSRNRDLAG